jgi:uncharacterized protein YlxW (UPF0749 family)
MEVILLVSTILTGANKLLENEAVGGALKAVTGWIGNLLGSNSSKAKLQQIEQNQNIEKNVSDIQLLLENALEGNQELQNQLAAKIEELQSVAKKEGITLPTATTSNTMTITGNENIGVQGVNVQGGNFSISK